MKNMFRKLLISEYFVLYLIVFYIVILYPFIPMVLHPMNIKDLLSNTWPLLAIAIGQTFVLIVAGIDLSQTSVMALTSVLGAVVMTGQADPILFEKSPLWGWALTEGGGVLSGSPAAVPVAVIVMLVTGAAVGLLNGISVAQLKMPPFIVTLVSMMFFSAVAIFLPKSENIRHLPQAFEQLGKGQVFIFPIAMIIALSLALCAHILLSKSLYGRRLYATGINENTARISGIPTKKIIISAYVISGICAAVASILYSARLEMGRPTLGSTLLLDVVGANVIGGISLSGGKGKITWTILGVVFFIVLSNTLSLLNLSFYMIDVVKGSVILIAAILDVVRSRTKGR
jgi:ribose/xylose/arabinose/galactoside ABC-type transport system permease subunit